MTALELFILAAWLWFCLVISDRPFQMAIFLPPMILIASIADFCKKLYEFICNLVDLMGEW